MRPEHGLTGRERGREKGGWPHPGARVRTKSNAAAGRVWVATEQDRLNVGRQRRGGTGRVAAHRSRSSAAAGRRSLDLRKRIGRGGEGRRSWGGVCALKAGPGAVAFVAPKKYGREMFGLGFVFFVLFRVWGLENFECVSPLYLERFFFSLWFLLGFSKKKLMLLFTELKNH